MATFPEADALPQGLREHGGLVTVWDARGRVVVVDRGRGVTAVFRTRA